MEKNDRQMMISIRGGGHLVVLALLGVVVIGDPEKLCVVHESCVLPCTFNKASEEVIHWTHQKGENLVVHYYHDHQDDLETQDIHFSGRTSLFHDKISSGDASLQLTNVKVQDAGKYKCYVGTSKGNKESFVTLKVEAPVVRVDIQLNNNTVTCVSWSIYPRPQLTWSTEPPPENSLQGPVDVQENSQKLFDISSSLTLIAADYGVSYVCSVSTAGGSKSAAVRRLAPMHSSPKSSVLIPCGDSGMDLKDLNLTWRFNHTEVILCVQYLSDQAPPLDLKSWKGWVKEVSKNGSLLLQELQGNHTGIYTCELSSANKTSVFNTELIIPDAHPATGNRNIIIRAIIVITPVIAAIILFIILIIRKRRKQAQTNRNEEMKKRKSNSNERLSLRTLPAMEESNGQNHDGTSEKIP